MGDRGWDALSEAERVSAHIIGAFPKWIVKSVEEIGSRWAQKVLYVLLQRVDVFPTWVLCNLIMQIISNFSQHKQVGLIYLIIIWIVVLVVLLIQNKCNFIICVHFQFFFFHLLEYFELKSNKFDWTFI